MLLHFSDGLMNTMGPATQQRLMEALLAVSQRKYPMLLNEYGFESHLNRFMSPAPSYSKNQDGNAGEKKNIVDKYLTKNILMEFTYLLVYSRVFGNSTTRIHPTRTTPRYPNVCQSNNSNGHSSCCPSHSCSDDGLVGAIMIT